MSYYDIQLPVSVIKFQFIHMNNLLEKVIYGKDKIIDFTNGTGEERTMYDIFYIS